MHEANDFTLWLAEEDNLNSLADALGQPDLALVATEDWVSSSSTFCVPGGDDQVINETQF